ncbi:MAG: hypothetical protein ACYS9T_03560, partial [Planctomycetota bacterium]
MKNKRFLTFLFCLVLTVSAQGYSPEYDENGELTLLRADRDRDGYINIADIGHVASAWLEQDCGLSNPCEGADIFPEGGDGVVDFRDFAVHAEAYGLCVDPQNPNCVHVPLTLYEPPSGGGGCVGAVGTGLAFALAVPAGQAAGNYSGNLTYTLDSGSDDGDGGRERNSPGGGEQRHNEYIPFQPGAPGWADSGTSGSFGTYGGQGAKPLVPGGGGVYNNTNMGWIFHDVTFGADKAPGGAGDDDYVFGNWGFGTYGNQGIKPLWPILPSLPGGGGDIFFSNPQFAYPGGDFGDQLLINQTLTYGTYGNQGAKPLVPSLPEDEYKYFGGITTYQVSADNGFVTVPTPSLSSYGTYGNQGAKPFLPSLPGGGESFATCVHSGICGKQGNAGVDTGWTDPSGGGGDSRETIIAIIDAAEVASVLHPELSDEPMAEDEDVYFGMERRGNNGTTAFDFEFNPASGEFMESDVDMYIP